MNLFHTFAAHCIIYYYNVDNSNIRGGLSTLLLTEIELFQLSATDNDSDVRYW
jgi:hypothetical protein